ncbi:MmcQ/YjbR family DNA-binding protein [Foetidibacter luteolus]|uniref:MmcQ/YjbR family DNA-binding protein n=1 Tax=Foetidibacter luteolus TaxID=2608880 RepID=UPI001A9923E6|nr:MmcQ/YjbR family DNA-binding protein [Foetidibacter luteolus]
MSLETIQSYCNSLPQVTETVQWGEHLVFKVGGKIFCILGTAAPISASFKVTEEDFAELTERDGIGQAPYSAKRQWAAAKLQYMSKAEWQHYLKKSYDLVVAKLTKKLRTELGL